MKSAQICIGTGIRRSSIGSRKPGSASYSTPRSASSSHGDPPGSPWRAAIFCMIFGRTACRSSATGSSGFTRDYRSASSAVSASSTISCRSPREAPRNRRCCCAGASSRRPTSTLASSRSATPWARSTRISSTRGSKVAAGASSSSNSRPENRTRSHALHSGLARPGQVAVVTCATTYEIECTLARFGEDDRGVRALLGNRPAKFANCCRVPPEEGFFTS